MSTPYRSRNAPIINPFDQLPTHDFDAFVTDVSSAIKHALNPRARSVSATSSASHSTFRPTASPAPSAASTSRYNGVTGSSASHAHRGATVSRSSLSQEIYREDEDDDMYAQENARPSPRKQPAAPPAKAAPVVVDLTFDTSDEEEEELAEPEPPAPQRRANQLPTIAVPPISSAEDDEEEEEYEDEDEDAMGSEHSEEQEDGDVSHSFLDDTFEMQAAHQLSMLKGKARAPDEGPGVRALHGLSQVPPAADFRPTQPQQYITVDDSDEEEVEVGEFDEGGEELAEGYDDDQSGDGYYEEYEEGDEEEPYDDERLFEGEGGRSPSWEPQEEAEQPYDVDAEDDYDLEDADAPPPNSFANGMYDYANDQDELVESGSEDDDELAPPGDHDRAVYSQAQFVDYDERTPALEEDEEVDEPRPHPTDPPSASLPIDPELFSEQPPPLPMQSSSPSPSPSHIPSIEPGQQTHLSPFNPPELSFTPPESMMVDAQHIRNAGLSPSEGYSGDLTAGVGPLPASDYTVANQAMPQPPLDLFASVQGLSEMLTGGNSQIGHAVPETPPAQPAPPLTDEAVNLFFQLMQQGTPAPRMPEPESTPLPIPAPLNVNVGGGGGFFDGWPLGADGLPNAVPDSLDMDAKIEMNVEVQERFVEVRDGIEKEDAVQDGQDQLTEVAALAKKIQSSSEVPLTESETVAPMSEIEHPKVTLPIDHSIPPSASQFETQRETLESLPDPQATPAPTQFVTPAIPAEVKHLDEPVSASVVVQPAETPVRERSVVVIDNDEVDQLDDAYRVEEREEADEEMDADAEEEPSEGVAEAESIDEERESGYPFPDPETIEYPTLPSLDSAPMNMEDEDSAGAEPPLPDPQAAPPPTEFKTPAIPTEAKRLDEHVSASVIAQPPETDLEPPSATSIAPLAVDEGDDFKMPDPKAPPPPTDLPPPEIPESVMALNDEPSPSVVVEPPETPLELPSASSTGPLPTEAAISEDETKLPDPSAPPLPTYLPPPDIPDSVMALNEHPSSSIMVEPPETPLESPLDGSEPFATSELPTRDMTPTPASPSFAPSDASTPVASRTRPGIETSISTIVEPPTSPPYEHSTSARSARMTSPAINAARQHPLSMRFNDLRRSVSGGPPPPDDDDDAEMAFSPTKAVARKISTSSSSSQVVSPMSPLKENEELRAMSVDQAEVEDDAILGVQGNAEVSSDADAATPRIFFDDSTPVEDPTSSVDASAVSPPPYNASHEVPWLSMPESRTTSDAFTHASASEVDLLLDNSPSVSDISQSSTTLRRSTRKRQRTDSISNAGTPSTSNTPLTSPINHASRRLLKPAKKRGPRGSRAKSVKDDHSDARSSASSVVSSSSRLSTASRRRSHFHPVVLLPSIHHFHNHQHNHSNGSANGSPSVGPSSQSSGSLVTRSQCRFHRVSAPGLIPGTSVFFIVPGCSLSATDVIEEEGLEDCGIASEEDNLNKITDVSHLDSRLASVLRKLVGPDLMHEGVCGYLPAPESRNEEYGDAPQDQVEPELMGPPRAPHLTVPAPSRSPAPASPSSDKRSPSKKSPKRPRRSRPANDDLADYIPTSDPDDDAPNKATSSKPRKSENGEEEVDLAAAPLDPAGLLTDDGANEEGILQDDTAASPSNVTVRRKRSKKRPRDTAYKPTGDDGSSSSDETASPRKAKRRRGPNKSLPASDATSPTTPADVDQEMLPADATPEPPAMPRKKSSFLSRGFKYVAGGFKKPKK